jgi:two-component system sensor histidine kinase/response regulator
MDDYVAKPIDRDQLARALKAGARRAAMSGAPAPTSVAEAPSPASGTDAGGDDGFNPRLPLEILREFGAEPLSRLVSIFRTEANRLLATAVASVAEGDIDLAERSAHTLKSSAANLGAQGLYENCARLEALARSGTMEGAADLTMTMADQLGSALGHLDAMVAAAGLA